MAEKFNYKYTALTENEKLEVDNIRSQYIEQKKELSKIDLIRKLDNKVKNVPTIIALSIGVISTLIFGTGLTFFLEWTKYKYVGIPFAILGMLMTLMAYPIYNKVHNHMKKKYGAKIIELSNELLNEDNND